MDSVAQPVFQFNNLRAALEEIKDRWWTVLLRGILVIVIGVLMLIEPAISLRTWIFVFGAFALADGVLAGLTAIKRLFGEGSWWPYLFQAIISIAFGFIAIVYPDLTAVGLLYVIAAWAIISGIMRIITGFRIRHAISGEFWIILSGILWVVLGVALFVLDPSDGWLGVLIAAGILFIIGGIGDIISSWRLKNLDVDRIVSAYENAANLSAETLNKVIKSQTRR